jgi:hypothetical protein
MQTINRITQKAYNIHFKYFVLAGLLREEARKAKDEDLQNLCGLFMTRCGQGMRLFTKIAEKTGYKLIKPEKPKINITPTNSSKFGLKTDLSNYFGENPEFIIPISSVTHYNIEPLKWALFDIVKENRKNANSI